MAMFKNTAASFLLSGLLFSLALVGQQFWQFDQHQRELTLVSQSLANELTDTITTDLANGATSNVVQQVKLLHLSQPDLEFVIHKGDSLSKLQVIAQTDTSTRVSPASFINQQRFLNNSVETRRTLTFQGSNVGILTIKASFQLPWLMLATGLIAILLLSLVLAGWQVSRQRGHLASIINHVSEDLKVIANQHPVRSQIQSRESVLKPLIEVANQLLVRVNSSEKSLQSAEQAIVTLQNDLEHKVKERVEVLEQAAKVAEKASEAKTTFLATMSHEIRTPMNGIVGSIEILRQSELTASQYRLSTTIRESAMSLLRILDDILDFSKIEAGKLELESIPISITDIVEAVGRIMSSMAQQNKLELELYIDPNIPEGLLGDTVRLRQILFNLAGNAIKFTQTTNARQGKVTIQAVLVDNTFDFKTIEFRVKDNGRGMTQRQVNYVFHPFNQAEGSITREYGGTGLGLSICKKLTELMYGTIRVESVPGEGSEFIVSIPLRSNHHLILPHKDELRGYTIVVHSNSTSHKRILHDYIAFMGAEVVYLESVGSVPKVPYNNTIWVFDTTINDNKAQQVADVIFTHPNYGHQQQIILTGLNELCDQRHRSRFYFQSIPLCKSSFINALLIASGKRQREVPETEELDISEYCPTIEEARSDGTLILLAEDNIMNQQVIVEQLNLLGYAVEVAKDGEEALEMWQKYAYPLILTDLHMPKMSGYDLAKQVRLQGPEHEDDRGFSHIIAITANALKGERERCLSVGMDDYLTKPIELETLSKILKRWVPTSSRNYSEEKRKEAETKKQMEHSPINFEALQHFLGKDSEKHKKYLKLYAEHGHKIIQRIGLAITGQDQAQCHALAHQLKSASKSVGAMGVAEIAYQIEQECEDGQKPVWADVELQFEQMAFNQRNIELFVSNRYREKT